jgi:hypothetical protein
MTVAASTDSGELAPCLTSVASCCRSNAAIAANPRAARQLWKSAGDTEKKSSPRLAFLLQSLTSASGVAIRQRPEQTRRTPR